MDGWLQLAQRTDQMRLLQQSLDDRRAELMRAEQKLRDTEEQLYTSCTNVNDKLKHDLRVHYANAVGSRP